MKHDTTSVRTSRHATAFTPPPPVQSTTGARIDNQPMASTGHIIRDLDGAVSELEARLQVLTVNLAPVLSQNPREEPVPAPIPPTNGSELQSGLAELYSRITRARLNINDLIARIE